MLLPADLAAPPVAFVLGVAVVFLLVPIVIAETIGLRLLKWDSLWRSFVAALAMNVVSSLVGFLLLSVAATVPESDVQAVLLLSLLPAWALSTLIEAGVMQAFQRLAFRRTLGIAAIANVASYVLLVGFVLLNSIG
jgi:hypothetical protein